VVLAQEAGGLPLGVQGVHGDDHARQVQALEAGCQFGDLVRLRAHLSLRQCATLAHVEGRQEVHLAAVQADGPADRLAVRGGLRAQAGHGRLAGLRGGAALLPLVADRLRQVIGRSLGHGSEVAVHSVVQYARIDPGEDAAERALAGRPYLPRFTGRGARPGRPGSPGSIRTPSPRSRTVSRARPR
jgi:hypothetical protein